MREKRLQMRQRSQGTKKATDTCAPHWTKTDILKKRNRHKIISWGWVTVYAARCAIYILLLTPEKSWQVLLSVFTPWTLSPQLTHTHTQPQPEGKAGRQTDTDRQTDRHTNRHSTPYTNESYLALSIAALHTYLALKSQLSPANLSNMAQTHNTCNNSN